jgi:hypothetical protein
MLRDSHVAAMHPANCEIRDRTIDSGLPLSSGSMRPALIMSAAKSLIQPADRREVEVVVLLPGRNHRRGCRPDISRCGAQYEQRAQPHISVSHMLLD